MGKTDARKTSKDFGRMHKFVMQKYRAMQDKVMLSMESRMRGDMQVRFGGRYEETYCRKAARRLVPSLRNSRDKRVINAKDSKPRRDTEIFGYKPSTALFGKVRIFN